MNDEKRVPLLQLELEKELLENEHIHVIELTSIEKNCIYLMAESRSMKPEKFLQAVSRIKF